MFEKWTKPAAKAEGAAEPAPDNVIEMKIPGVMVDPETNLPLGAKDIDEAKRMIRQAAEDQREAA